MTQDHRSHAVPGRSAATSTQSTSDATPGKRTLVEALGPAPAREATGPVDRAAATPPNSAASSPAAWRPTIQMLFGGPALAGGEASQGEPAQPRPAVQERAVAGSEGAPPVTGSSPAGGLPDRVRGQMEASLGADFSGVRVHVGHEAPAIGAHAFTRGEDIHFAPGQYDPQSSGGLKLLGHELAHVVQQREGRVAANVQAHGLDVNADPALEQEADVLGDKAAAGEPARSTASASSSPASSPVVQGRWIQIGSQLHQDGQPPLDLVVAFGTVFANLNQFYHALASAQLGLQSGPFAAPQSSQQHGPHAMYSSMPPPPQSGYPSYSSMPPPPQSGYPSHSSMPPQPQGFYPTSLMAPPSMSGMHATHPLFTPPPSMAPPTFSGLNASSPLVPSIPSQSTTGVPSMTAQGPTSNVGFGGGSNVVAPIASTSNTSAQATPTPASTARPATRRAKHSRGPNKKGASTHFPYKLPLNVKSSGAKKRYNGPGNKNKFAKIENLTQRSGLPDRLTKQLVKDAKDDQVHQRPMTAEATAMASAANPSLSGLGVQRNHVQAVENVNVFYASVLTVLTDHSTDVTERDEARKHGVDVARTLTRDDAVVQEVKQYLDEVDSSDDETAAAASASHLGRVTADHPHNIDLGHDGRNMAMSNRPDPTLSPGRTHLLDDDADILDGLEDPFTAMLGTDLGTAYLEVPTSPGGQHYQTSKTLVAPPTPAPAATPSNTTGTPNNAKP